MIIKRVESPEEFISALRNVAIKGDAAVKPYRDANLSIEHVRLSDLMPLSKYVLEDQLLVLRSLRNRMESVGVDIFDLGGRVTFIDGGRESVVGPPLVEVWEGEGALLVDGLHRTWLARDEGRESISATVITGVKVPLVPMPTTWEAIRWFAPGLRPTAEEKREYRFRDPAAVRSVIPGSADRVTASNYEYFLFRMLEMTGSEGIRRPADERAGTGRGRE